MKLLKQIEFLLLMFFLKDNPFIFQGQEYEKAEGLRRCE